MFITEKITCTTEFGYGVRYVIFLTDESDENGYEVSTDAIISDLKKYPWLTGITIAGKEPFDRPQMILPLLQKLPEHLDINIVSDSHYQFITDSVVYKSFAHKCFIIRESDLDYYIQKQLNNEEV